MKKVVTSLLMGVMLVGIACSVEPQTAEDRFNVFMEKYEPVQKDLQEAFGSDSSQTFEEYVADEGCVTMEEESVGMAIVILGPMLAEHGLSDTTFIKDLRDLNDAIRSEGICGSGDKPEPIVSTTTSTSTSPLSCPAAMDEVDDYLNKSKENPELFDKKKMDFLMSQENKICS